MKQSLMALAFAVAFSCAGVQAHSSPTPHTHAPGDAPQTAPADAGTGTVDSTGTYNAPSEATLPGNNTDVQTAPVKKVNPKGELEEETR